MKNWILGTIYILGLTLVYWWVGVQHSFQSLEKENNALKTYISLRKDLECGK